MANKNDPSTNDQNNSEQDTRSASPLTEKAEKHYGRAAKEKGTLRDPMFWLLFCTFLATSGAAFFTGQQWITADQTMRIGQSSVYLLHQLSVHSLRVQA